jgi:hypothetical protein
MKVLAAGNEFDRRVRLVGELEVNDLIARAQPGVEVLVLEVEREANSGRVELDGSREVCRP